MNRNPVLESVRRIIPSVRHVMWSPDRVEEIVEAWWQKFPRRATWRHPCHYFDGSEETVRWIFVLDVLNHSFWVMPEEMVWTVNYRGSTYSGYWGLAAALKKAHEVGIPITEARFLASIGAQDMEILFGGEGILPLMEKRKANLREAGRQLLRFFDGDPVNLVSMAGRDPVRLASLLTRYFPSFRDEAFYEGHRVLFWKRAQLFVSDLHTAFQGRGWGNFRGVERLTAFADYKLPQVLREMGILRYHSDLAARVDAYEEIEAGSEEEVEIRAMTIWVVEKLKQAFLRKELKVTSAMVDQWLWELGQGDPYRRRPYHRCRTIYY